MHLGGFSRHTTACNYGLNKKQNFTHMSTYVYLLLLNLAQRVKRWLSKLECPVRVKLVAEIFSTINRVLLHTISLCPGMSSCSTSLGKGRGGQGARSPNNLRGGPTYPLPPPPNNPSTFFYNFYVKQEKVTNVPK